MPTFSEYAHEYIDRKSYDLAASTVTNYKHYADKIGRAVDVQIADIKPLHNDVLAKALRTAGLSDIKVASVMIFFHQVLIDAFENGIVSTAPKRSKLKKASGSGIKQHLDQDVIKKVIDGIDPFYQPIFKFMSLTGCRPCEALALKWADITDAIVISRGRVRGIEGNTKTKRARVLHLTPALRRLLDNMPRKSDYVFCGKTGKPLSSNLDKYWRASATALGVDAVSYSLRHSFASNFIKQGATLPAVAKIIGHSSILTTARYYVGTTGDTDTNNLLDKLYG